LTIGTLVEGNYRVVPYDDVDDNGFEERKLKREYEPFKGAISGAKYVSIGYINYSPDDGWTFDVRGKVFVFLVRESWIGKEIYVLPEDINVVNDDNFSLPILNTHWPEDVRKIYSNEMKEWPRDEKGRWIKKETNVN